jgi:hypothetical protein
MLCRWATSSCYEAAEAAKAAKIEEVDEVGFLPFPHQKIARAILFVDLAFDCPVLVDLKSHLALLAHR